MASGSHQALGFGAALSNNLIRLVGRTGHNSPLEREAKTWFEQCCYDEPARISEDDEDPKSVDERTAKMLFAQAVTPPGPGNEEDKEEEWR